MKILHIAAHLGDGAGKAIGGLARLDAASGNENKILLLEAPIKRNHVDLCEAAGVNVLSLAAAEQAISWADVVVLNWWGSPVMDAFLRDFHRPPQRVLLWAHKNGLYDPPLPQTLVDACDGLLVTSALSLMRWPDATLVYGFGEFIPERIAEKKDYGLQNDAFTVGYVGSPSFKKLPADATDYFLAVAEAVPSVRFVLAGETTEEFRCAVEAAGLSERVALYGWTNNVSALLRNFDVFGYLLRNDSFATTENAVLEAMAAGLPVVMSREPIGKHVIGENAGILIETPEDFASR